MSESDDRLEEIREQKRAQLRQEMTGESAPEGQGERTATPDEPIHVRDQAHFSEIVETHEVVLVDFHADWCGPCKMLEPIVAELAAETDAAVAKVDVDELQRLAQEHRVQGVPTMIIFSDGEVAERIVGVREKHDLEQLLQRFGA
ncbi:MAG: thioredoxin [Halodesulfurarchaeum sp.]